MDLEISWGGQTHPLKLDDGEHTVGRSGDNAVKVLAGRVSKRHAMLRVDGERLFVRDLGSTNGTEMDGQRIGSEEVEVPATSSVNFGGAVLRRAVGSQATTSFIRSSDPSTFVHYNIREGFSDRARDRIMEVSSRLFELLAADRGAGDTEKSACEFVAGIVRADRVVMLVDQGEATSLEPRARWTRHKLDERAPFQLSSTIVGRVLRQRDAVLVANPLEDPGFGEQKSIMALNLRSAMAAPLFDNERVRGILYVDTADAAVRYNTDDLQVLSATANAVAIKLRNLTLESEMKTAARIQRSMLPRKLTAPPGYELEAFQLMCRAVGGDLYHCSPRADDKTLLALGDVAGKGMPAALAMGAATVLLGMLAEIDTDIETLTQHMHRQLFRSLGAEQFITLFVSELDGKTGGIRYVNAGHEPALLIRADGRLEKLDSTGLPVALIDELMTASGEATMEPGDLLVIFSDGIPEATTNGEKFLGIDHVEEILVSRRSEPLADIRKGIVESIQSFLAGDPMSDDVTLLLLRRSAA